MPTPWLFPNIPILVKGAGDLATGVAWRLHRCGFPVIMTEIAQPTVVRRSVAFAEAVYRGEMMVEGVVARRVVSAAEAPQVLEQGEIPVLVDPAARSIPVLHPTVVVDAIIAKRNIGTRIEAAPLVVALGPGFAAGVDCHAVIETQRGHWLGRVIWQGSAEPNTGTPGRVAGYDRERVLRAPVAGVVRAVREIGERVQTGELVAWVGDEPVVAPFPGVIRGLIHDRLDVSAGLKIGDVDPRGVREHCFTISDKSLAVAGGVLEAVLSSNVIRERMG